MLIKRQYEMKDVNLESEARMMCCSACGIAEVDDVKLTQCSDYHDSWFGCDLVRYCSDKCQEDHRLEHEEACTKRAAELRDEILFKQPEGTHLGDCPICSLPLLIDPKKSRMQTCCSKLICAGCSCANDLRHLQDKIQTKCPFCRHLRPKTMEEAEKNLMKRVAANDPAAMMKMGSIYRDEGDYDHAFKYLTRAAELGDAHAHYNLSGFYWEGLGIEKDENKVIYHLEEAAIAGHPNARHYLGAYEGMNGRFERAVRHYIIAANLGLEDAIKALKDCYKNGDICKDEYARALRSYQAAVDATKSPQREAAAKLIVQQGDSKRWLTNVAVPWSWL